MAQIYTLSDGSAYSFPDGRLLLLGSPVALVTDRTAADVARWRALHDKGWAAMTPAERTEWSNGMKGAYNYSDMNRVESAVEYLVTLFADRGTNLTLTMKTDWTNTSYPTRTDMARYFGNVEALRNATGVALNAPPTPTVDTRFDYQKANDLEKILLAVEEWLDSVNRSRYYSGELHSGEV